MYIAENLITLISNPQGYLVDSSCKTVLFLIKTKSMFLIRYSYQYYFGKLGILFTLNGSGNCWRHQNYKWYRKSLTSAIQSHLNVFGDLLFSCLLLNRLFNTMYNVLGISEDVRKRSVLRGVHVSIQENSLYRYFLHINCRGGGVGSGGWGTGRTAASIAANRATVKDVGCNFLQFLRLKKRRNIRQAQKYYMDTNICKMHKKFRWISYGNLWSSSGNDWRTLCTSTAWTPLWLSGVRTGSAFFFSTHHSSAVRAGISAYKYKQVLIKVVLRTNKRIK